MKDNEMEEKSGAENTPGNAVGRRDLMKLGAGAVVSALAAPLGSAQQGQGAARRAAIPPGAMRNPGDITPFTGPGYKNDFARFSENGPMDDTTRKIVSFVHGFNESSMPASTVREINRTMVDSIAAIVAGFEEPQCRIAARLARQCMPVDLKCTVLGYGISTTPELATFANSCLIRATDFNDNGQSRGHESDLIPAALAIGEAMHSTGSQVMQAIAIGYELRAAPTGGESVAAAMAAGKLMGLDEDHLANALTIALTPHVALNKGVGAMSMWKGTRSAEAMKCGVWAAMLAREGMTGPPQPFEGRGGLWSRNPGDGMGPEFTLPVQPGQLAIERNWFKRRPAEASSQGILVLMPEIRAWTKPNEVASIHWDTSYGNWEEICDAPKWDPRNRETADHSLPYIIARAMLDGDVYLDSFFESKFMDPAARALMDVTTISPVPGWDGNGSGRLTITKKSGETKYWDTYDGVRVLTRKDYPTLTDEELTEKFNRACAYQHVNEAQRDKAHAIWANLSAVKEIGEAMQALAKFGQPKPL